MNAKIGNWGGSAAIRVPKKAAKLLGLTEGSEVDISVRDGALIIRPVVARYTLAQLLDEAEGLTPPALIDDEPQGNEWPAH